MTTRRLSMADVPEPVRSVVPSITTAMEGRSGVLLVSVPGVGGTMIARRLTTLMEPLTDAQARWLAAEYDGAGLPWDGETRPFRAPHHSCSSVAVCGGTDRCPGESRLARFGVLMLDDVAEFRWRTLIDLRFSLLAMGSTAPTIVATSTPCGCGWLGATRRSCECSTWTRNDHSKRTKTAADVLGLVTIEVPEMSLSAAQAHYGQMSRLDQ